MPTREQLEELIAPHATTKLECDGFARVVHWLLLQNNVQHTVYFGHATVYHPGDEHADSDLVNPHFWIVCDGWTIDYNLRRWTTEEAQAPHGVFEVDPKHVKYEGEPIDLKMTQIIFDILTGL